MISRRPASRRSPPTSAAAIEFGCSALADTENHARTAESPRNVGPMVAGRAPARTLPGRDHVMRRRIMTSGLALALVAVLCGLASPALAQAPAPASNLGPVQP